MTLPDLSIIASSKTLSGLKPSTLAEVTLVALREIGIQGKLLERQATLSHHMHVSPLLNSGVIREVYAIETREGLLFPAQPQASTWQEALWQACEKERAQRGREKAYNWMAQWRMEPINRTHSTLAKSYAPLAKSLAKKLKHAPPRSQAITRPESAPIGEDAPNRGWASHLYRMCDTLRRERKMDIAPAVVAVVMGKALEESQAPATPLVEQRVLLIQDGTCFEHTRFGFQLDEGIACVEGQGQWGNPQAATGSVYMGYEKVWHPIQPMSASVIPAPDVTALARRLVDSHLAQWQAECLDQEVPQVARTRTGCRL